jgi:dCTP deaminase
MYLADIDIKKAIKEGDIVIKDFDKKRLQPATYDILLGNKFFLTETHTDGYIDPYKKKFPKVREIVLKKGEYFVLHPGVSVLAWSKDYFGSSKYLIQLSGKSSLARIGLIVHNTAGIVNPGHYLNITLELYNLNNIPIILRPDMEIAQLTFSKLSSDPKIEYHHIHERYVDQREDKSKTRKKGPAKKTIKKKK